jgi:uncharacterized damage-inducible protein DinB
MTLESLLHDYADFNLWANTELVQWLKTKPVELMEQEVVSSYPSIKLTLLHIWGAEKIWLERLEGHSPATFLSLDFVGSSGDVFEGLLQQSEAFKLFVQGLSAADLEEVSDFRLLNGTEDRRSRAYMIHHCLNHSTYHRGQVVTIARNLGLSDPPSTDFIKYLRLK